MDNNVYAKPGESFQQVGGSCPDECIHMMGERPGVEYVADASGEWVLPKAVVPDRVTPFQWLAALNTAGYLVAVEAHFNDADTPLLYRLAYQRSTTWERGSSIIKYMAGVMDWDDAKVEALLVAASKIEG